MKLTTKRNIMLVGVAAVLLVWALQALIGNVWLTYLLIGLLYFPIGLVLGMRSAHGPFRIANWVCLPLLCWCALGMAESVILDALDNQFEVIPLSLSMSFLGLGMW